MKKRSVMLFTFVMVIAIAVIFVITPIDFQKKSNEPETAQTPSPSESTDKEISNASKAKQLVSQMTDKEKIGQLVMYTPTGQADSFSNKMIKEYGVGSALLNRRMNSAAGTARFTNALQQLGSESRLGIPLFISGDLEYGAAQRVPDEATVLPRQMAIGATQNVDYAEQAARLTAVESKAMGFHWSFSPVVDVNSNLMNPVIGVRSFGEDTKLVSDMAVAEVRGYQSEGMISSAKHFPGHGDTGFDTHMSLSKVSYSEEVLRTVHLPPFQAVINQGIESIMTSHIIIEAIDAELPATLSKKVLTGLLRKEMGFKGIIVTDAMVMQAISDNWGAGEAAVMAINAGADIVMANGSEADQFDTLESLYEALQAGKLERSRMDESVERILTYKFKLEMFEHRLVDINHVSQVVGKKEHRELSERMALESITLIKNENVLPFDAEANQTTLVVSMAYADQIAEAVRQISKGKVISYQAAEAAGEVLDATRSAVKKAVEKAENADRIIVFTKSDQQIPQGQVDLVNGLLATGKPVAAVSLGNPSDILGYPNVKAYVSTYALDNWYWITPIPISWEAAVKVIFGSKPQGKLPVTLNNEYSRNFGLSYR
ncbi:glycoside hydrolase family 3 protein [Paenibacillus sp. NRS-1760]|uniref:glycoside hydrolase family 3 protein n=1 Tax=Paenibacillus sp. NRS-1760 TaxID=3233902 RepID=UPI003D2D7E94